jgi:hypothetical protein
MDQNGGQSGRGLRCWPRVDEALPAERRSLPPSGMVRMRNVVSPIVPAGTAERHPQGCADERAGKGGRSKRTSVCNGSDRGSNFALPQKGADFRLVLNHENGEETLNLRGFFGQ